MVWPTGSRRRRACSPTVSPSTRDLAPPSDVVVGEEAPGGIVPGADAQDTSASTPWILRGPVLVAGDDLALRAITAAPRQRPPAPRARSRRRRPRVSVVCGRRRRRARRAGSLPAMTIIRLVPSAAIWLGDLGAGAAAERDHRDDRGDADDDAEHRQRRAHPVARALSAPMRTIDRTVSGHLPARPTGALRRRRAATVGSSVDEIAAVAEASTTPRARSCGDVRLVRDQHDRDALLG